MTRLQHRAWRFGADVNTDLIVPGRYAPYMTSEDELRKYPFVEERPAFAKEGHCPCRGRIWDCPRWLP